MGVKEDVRELLEGAKEAVSGEEMAQKLGVSRNSIWKAVKKLQEEGYEIDAGTNRGYRLVGDSAVLSPETIREYLEPQAAGVAIDVREQVTSTNTVLKELAEQGGREGMVLVAKSQTGGKGRLGRRFVSPKGTGLYLSVLLRPGFSAEEALSITTAAAVAVAQGVEKVSGREAKIKWVNDVYVAGRKICGILTEAAIDFESGGLSYAVLGIGVNISPPEGGFPPEVADVAGAVFEKDPPGNPRAQLAAEILNRFFEFYSAMPQRVFMEEYKRRSLLTGMEVTYTQGERQEEGTVLGVDDEARLIVKLKSGGEKRFSAGEVNIKRDFLDKLRAEEGGKQP